MRPTDESFMLVLKYMDIDLMKYLIKNRNKITWKTKLQIIFEVIKAISRIHEEKFILRDLNSRNILYSQEQDDWCINDLKFCGSSDKKLDVVYGFLPYIAPEVIHNCNYSYSSDIYSLGILMWEIAFEQSPFININHDSTLARNIANGMRPKITDIPPYLEELITLCWDKDPLKRPDIKTLWEKVENITDIEIEFVINTTTNGKTNQLTENEYHSKYYNFEYN